MLPLAMEDRERREAKCDTGAVFVDVVIWENEGFYTQHS
jgi:hypothetical protein